MYTFNAVVGTINLLGTLSDFEQKLAKLSGNVFDTVEAADSAMKIEVERRINFIRESIKHEHRRINDTIYLDIRDDARARIKRLHTDLRNYLQVQSTLAT